MPVFFFSPEINVLKLVVNVEIIVSFSSQKYTEQGVTAMVLSISRNVGHGKRMFI